MKEEKDPLERLEKLESMQRIHDELTARQQSLFNRKHFTK
jgi:hypothetical protein